MLPNQYDPAEREGFQRVRDEEARRLSSSRTRVNPMLYHVQNYAPKPGMGDAGFSVMLWPAWRDAIASIAERSPDLLTPENVRHVLNTLGEKWLDGHGYGSVSPSDGRRVWEARTSLRVTWGPWGPEHISVPGNACGLDIGDGFGAPPGGGRVLTPHNVDSVDQASLLLTVFLFFADTIVMNQVF